MTQSEKLEFGVRSLASYNLLCNWPNLKPEDEGGHHHHSSSPPRRREPPPLVDHKCSLCITFIRNYMQFIVLSLMIGDSWAILLDGRCCSRDSLTHDILLLVYCRESERYCNTKCQLSMRLLETFYFVVKATRDFFTFFSQFFESILNFP